MEIKNFWFHEESTLNQLDPKVSRRILAYHENMMIIEVAFETDGIGPIHQHPHEQITYVLAGSFAFVIGGVKKVINKGDSIYMEKDVVHGCVCLAKGMLLDIFTPYREDFILKEKIK